MPAPARADVTFCSPGAGPGQCLSPQGVATDVEEGRLYVAERNNDRISVFEVDEAEGEVDFLFAFGWGVDTGAEAFETCTVASGCQKGVSGSGAGQFHKPAWIAVDNTTGSGEIYVSDEHNHRISRFKPTGNTVSFVHAFGWGVNAEEPQEELQKCTAITGCQAGTRGDGLGQLGGSKNVVVGPGGRVFVLVTLITVEGFANKVKKFNAEGEFLGTTKLAPGHVRLKALAVDEAEDAYVAVEFAGGELRKYDLAVDEEELCDLDDGIHTLSLAFDQAGQLFAMQREEPDALSGGVHLVVTEYDISSCPPTTHLRRFGYGKVEENMDYLAALHVPSLGDVFGTDPRNDVINYVSLPPAGPLVARVEPPLSVGNLRATVRAEVNPEGKASAAVFEYVDDESFKEDVDEGGDGFEGPNTRAIEKPVPLEAEREFRATAVEFLLGCEEASEEAIENGECLTPETTYHYRVVAINADGEDELDGGQLTTLEPLEIQQTYVSGPAPDAMTLNAVVNPLGSQATGYFEYVDEATYQESGFAAAEQVPAVSEGAEPLDFGGGEAPIARSATLAPLPEATSYRFRVVIDNPFGTRTGPERSFATLSSIEANVDCPNASLREGPGAFLPDCRAYEMVSPLDKANGDVVVRGLSQSSISGDRLTYGATRAFGDAKAAPFVSQYLAERTAGGWRGRGITPGLGESIRGTASFSSEFGMFSPDLCRGWTVPLYEPDPPLIAEPEEGHPNLYRRTDQLCTGGGSAWELLSTGQPSKMTTGFRVEPQGQSADATITAFTANDSLSGTAAPGQPSDCEDGEHLKCLRRAYVVQAGGDPAYACILPTGSPSATSCSVGGGAAPFFGVGTASNLTNALSADGTRLYWTDSSAAGRIYVRENPLAKGPQCVGGGSACTRHVSKAGEEASGSAASRFWAAARDGSRAYYSTGGDLYLFELASGASTPVASGFVGFMGASADAGRVYFVSSEAIPGSGENSEGEEAIASQPNLYLYEVSTESHRFIATLAAADVASDPAAGTSVTATEPGDRNGRVTPSGDAAAFMSEAPLTGYDNTDASSTASCGEPEGICDNEVFTYDAEADELLCVSCNPSGARPEGANLASVPPLWVAARIPSYTTSLHAPRALSQDGSRLIFESQDALVSRDTNGKLDVYQWERPGTGRCEEGKGSYVPRAGGCVALISTGQSGDDSLFVDASPSGSDVFFTTLESLWGPDFGSVDLYDARVGGGFAPPPEPPPECEGEGCQSPPPAPEFEAPSSNAYSGPGNLAQTAGSPATRCNRAARRARRHSRRAKRARRNARRAKAPAARGKARRAARRNARSARRLSRNAKRCRARARAARRSQR